MNEHEIRTVVREAIARHLGSARQAPEPDPTDLGFHPPARHASHVLLPIRGGGELDGRCLIESAVMCTHCGYCQSYGH